MDDHATAQRRAFAERLDRIRGAHPGWDIRATPARQVGWIALRDGERLWAVTLTELEVLLDRRPRGAAPGERPRGGDRPAG